MTKKSISKNKSEKIAALSWNRFTTRGFAIGPDLVGNHHSFIFSNRVVRLELPNATYEELVAQSDGPPNLENRLDVFSWKANVEPKILVGIAVANVDLTIDFPNKILVHKEQLDRPPNAYDFVNQKEQQGFEKISAEYSQIAFEAIDYWLRVMRWKSNNSFFGRPLVRGPESGWGTYLLEKETNHRIWAHHGPLIAPHLHIISEPEWLAAQNALTKKEIPPLYIEPFLDAVFLLEINDLRRSVVDFAVSCEVYLRTRINDFLPKDLPESMAEYLDFASISKVMRKFLPELLSSKGRAKFDRISSNLYMMFEARNRILHSGDLVNLTEAKVKSFFSSAEALMKFDEDQELWK